MIEEIANLSAKLKSRVDTGRISVEYPSAFALRIVPGAEDTFSIEVLVEDDLFVVSAADWESKFDDVDQVAAMVCWLLTPYYRIVRSTKAGEFIAKWVEIYTDEGWQGTRYDFSIDPTTIESPVENADEITIVQQAVFLDSAFPSYYPGAHLDQAGYPLGTILGETKYAMQNGDWQPVGVPLAE